jgi:phosphohistidine phosphatase
MKVWIVRHGDAVSDAVDPERPLSSEGRREVAAVARVLSGSGKVRPSAVIHSGKTRARQTAEILAEALDVRAVERADGLAPESDPSIWAERLEGRDGAMLVGHLPHMEGLVAQLLGAPDDAGLVRLVTGSVVCLVREAGQPTWTIAWLLTPGVVG